MKLAFYRGDKDTQQINKTPTDTLRAMRTVRQSHVMEEDSELWSYYRWGIREGLPAEVLFQN